MDIARSIQDVTDEIVTKTARHIKTITGMRTLCMAGGVALNCVSNGKIIKDGIFDEIWVQPAAGDAGGALGAALFTWHQYLNMPRVQNGQHDKMHGAYLGPAYDDAEIAGFLDGQQIPYTVIDKADIPEKIADLINDGMVIGLFNGRMEYGPRALGARSIIADARNSSMQENMNIKIKFRESFRPFAPSVLAERVSDYFDFEGSSPYMLIVADVHKDRRINNEQDDEKLFGVDKLKMNRSDIPAVTHVDYSARIQTVHKETNPLYYNIISAFERKYGCPVIINTSFNVRGEPIVCTYEDAYRCFIRTNMDYLLLGNCLLTKSDKHMSDTSNWQCEYELD
jgi:carbamoyltransferase